MMKKGKEVEKMKQIDVVHCEYKRRSGKIFSLVIRLSGGQLTSGCVPPYGRLAKSPAVRGLQV